MIIYASIANVSIARMFIGGIDSRGARPESA